MRQINEWNLRESIKMRLQKKMLAADHHICRRNIEVHEVPADLPGIQQRCKPPPEFRIGLVDKWNFKHGRGSTHRGYSVKTDERPFVTARGKSLSELLMIAVAPGPPVNLTRKYPDTILHGRRMPSDIRLFTISALTAAGTSSRQ